MDTSQIGKIFQELRQQRHYKTSDFIPTISKSTINRFENGETDLSLTKFLYALDKMKISLREFESHTYHFSSSHREEDLAQLYALYYHRDDAGLKTLGAQSEDWMLSIAAKCLYNELTTGKRLPVMQQEQLVDYLFTIDDWGTTELTFLNATISQLTPSRISTILDELHEHTKHHNEIFHFSRRVSQIYIKGAFTLVRTAQRKRSEKVLDYAREFTKLDDLFSLNMIQFVSGCWHKKFEDKVLGDQKISSAIAIFEVLGSNHHADFIRFIMEKYM